MKKIIYLTDNSIDKELHSTTKKCLLQAAEGIPIISVSQGPCDIGENIDVGDIGRSWMSLYKQQIIGLEACNPGDIVFIAEHDVLYTADHFKYEIVDRKAFHYNDHMWFLEWTDRKNLLGVYSKWPKKRLALSQLCADRDFYLYTTDKRLKLIEGGIRYARRFGEPGWNDERMLKLAKRATRGHQSLGPIFDQFMETDRHVVWKSLHPNIDIRHHENFTGPRRGKDRVKNLPYWGTIEDIRKNFS
jgi:hypothetical protein